MKFTTETVLTVLTSVAFEKGLRNAKELIGHITQAPVDELTFLDLRMKICADEIVRQHPQLKSLLTVRDISRNNYLEVLERAKARVGDSVEIQAIKNMPSPEKYIFDD